MNEADLKLCRYLSQQIDARTDHCARDGYENSQGHVMKIKETNRALYAVLMGEKPELPL